MKKRIISIMLTIAVFSAYTAAAAPVALSDEKPNTEKVYNCDKERKGKKNFRRGNGKRPCMKTGDVVGCHRGFPFKSLNLTEEQKAKVTNLMNKQRAEKEEYAKKCKESFDKNLKKILTPEQLKKYEEICKNRRADFQKMKCAKSGVQFNRELKQLKTREK